MENSLVLGSSGFPAVKDFNAYKRYVLDLPNLTEEKERELLVEFKEHNSLKSAQELILSQLKTVLHIAYQYRNYGLSEEDLVQEGNIGLMKAVKNYDLDHKVRLYSYALLWIKSEIQSYILKNWKIVKIGTTKNLKKLFFNYRQIQKEMLDSGVPKHELEKIMTHKLGVTPQEVTDIGQYFNSADIAIDPEENEESPILQLGHNQTPEASYMEVHDEQKRHDFIQQAIEKLTPRQQDIIKMRFFTDNKKTHKEISQQLGISSERVRQIENEAMSKMKKTLQEDLNVQEVF